MENTTPKRLTIREALDIINSNFVVLEAWDIARDRILELATSNQKRLFFNLRPEHVNSFLRGLGNVGLEDEDTDFMNRKTFSAEQIQTLHAMKNRKRYSVNLVPDAEYDGCVTFYAPNDEAAKRYLDRTYTDYGAIVEVITTFRDVD